MSKPRKLTEVEKFYIENNLNKTDQDISALMPGIGPKTVAKYKESMSVDTDHTTETREERIDRLGNGPETGKFIARQEGVSIMTQQASEVSDARKVVQGNTVSNEQFAGNNKDKIHRPQS